MDKEKIYKELGAGHLRTLYTLEISIFIGSLVLLTLCMLMPVYSRILLNITITSIFSTLISWTISWIYSTVVWGLLEDNDLDNPTWDFNRIKKHSNITKNINQITYALMILNLISFYLYVIIK